MTLNDILKNNPEWGNLPIVVYNEDGTYDWVGAAADVYEDKEGEDHVLVFASN